MFDQGNDTNPGKWNVVDQSRNVPNGIKTSLKIIPKQSTCFKQDSIHLEQTNVDGKIINNMANKANNIIGKY